MCVCVAFVVVAVVVEKIFSFIASFAHSLVVVCHNGI